MSTSMSRPSSSHVTTRTRAVVGAGVVAALLVGCAGGGDAEEEPTADSAVSASEGTIDPSAEDEPTGAVPADLLDASSRIAVITSCEGLLPSLAPALTENHVLTTDSVSSYGSTVNNAYSFTCVFTDSTDPADTVTLEGSAGRSTTSRDEVVDLYPEEEPFATDIAEHAPYGNVTFLKPTDNDDESGTFAAHVWAPNPPQASTTGTVRLTYDFATETEGGEPAADPTREAPSDDAALVALTGVLQAVD